MRTDVTISEAMERLGDELTAWRETRKLGARIPPELWSRIVEMASREGIGQTSRALRVDYGSLKRRMFAPTGVDKTAESEMAFVEILSPVSCNIAECSLRVESAQGGSLTVEVRNLALHGLVSILRAFQG